MSSTKTDKSTDFGVCEEQQITDEKFNSWASFWRDVYRLSNVLGEISRRKQDILLELVDSLFLSSESRVLEIGCGAGFLSLLLAERGFKVNATDHALAMVEMAKQHVERANMKNRIQIGVEDAHRLSFPNESFDLVVGLGVVPCLHDLKKALAELNRVLKPGGYVVLGVDNLWSVRLRGCLDFPVFSRSVIIRALEKLHILTSRSEKRGFRFNFYSIDQFEKYLQGAGFEKVSHSSFGFGPFTLFGRELPSTIGLVIQMKLQQYADGCFATLRKFATQNVVLAAKS